MTTNVTDDTSRDYQQRHMQWRRIRDAIEGSDKIKDGSTEYLPRPDFLKKSHPDAYNSYKNRAEFFPVVDRTLRGMTGTIFRNEPKIELPKRIESMEDTATNSGHSLNIMMQKAVREVLAMGRHGILVDFPTESTTALTVPYLSTYLAENIRNQRTIFKNGKRQLVRVWLRDDFDLDELDGGIAEDAERRLELIINKDGHYEVRKWVSNGQKGKEAGFVMVSSNIPTVNGKPLTEIPFIFINQNDLDPEMQLPPPMKEIVDTAISHYRNSADYEQALFMSAQATPYALGFSDAETPETIGPSVVWQSANESAKVGFLETTGAGIKHLREAMVDKEHRMAVLGALMMNDGKVRNETAETAKQRGRGEMSLMASAVNMVEEAVTMALKIAAEWTGSNPEEVELKINRDWVEVRMAPNELKELVAAWQAGAISHRTLFTNLQRGEVVGMEREFEDELDEIEHEGGGQSDQITAALFGAAGTPPPAPTPDAPKPGDPAPTGSGQDKQPET